MSLIPYVPTKFISSCKPSYHRRFYPEYGPAEYETAPSPSLELSFTIRSNPIDSPTFFMLIIEPAPKKVPYTFFAPSHLPFTTNNFLRKILQRWTKLKEVLRRLGRIGWPYSPILARKKKLITSLAGGITTRGPSYLPNQ